MINNGCVMISEGPGITLGENVLFGPEVLVVDSDFHALAPDRRLSGQPAMAAVVVESNAFVGARAIILKGVTIGANSVVAAGSVVVCDVPPQVVAGGNPCRVLADLPDPTRGP